MTWLAEKVGDRFLKKVEGSVTKRLENKPPSETVRIVSVAYPKPSWGFRWDEGELYYCLRAEWSVTNITTHDVTLVTAQLDSPPATTSVRRKVYLSDSFGEGPLLPHEPARVRVEFRTVAPDESKHDAFEATVTLVDQYGNEITRRETFLPDAEDEPPY